MTKDDFITTLNKYCDIHELQGNNPYHFCEHMYQCPSCESIIITNNKPPEFCVCGRIGLFPTKLYYYFIKNYSEANLKDVLPKSHNSLVNKERAV